jgi:3',5'-cyclic-AMP phosphodiesterase
MELKKNSKNKCLFIVISVIVIFSFACCKQQSNNGKNNEESFSFVFMTDIHIQSEKNAPEGLGQAIDTINKLNPDFVITGGDNVMDAWSQTYGRADSLYNLFIETMKQLNMPYYSTFGNHESFGRRTGLTHNRYKEMYENRIGSRYYSFAHKNWHFIILDAIMYGEGENYYYGQIDSVQMDWLRIVLDSVGKDTPIAVSLHIPILSVGYQIEEKGFTPRSVIKKENAIELIRLFEKYNVKVVLQGHLHMYEDILFNGIHYITGGAVCGGWWEDRIPGVEREEGFLLIKVNGKNFSSQYIEYGWEVKNRNKK